MCFKPPKPPPVVEDPELKAQQEAAKADAQTRRAKDKQAATSAEIARQSGAMGRGALLTGGQGGAGFVGTFARALLGQKV